MVGNAMFNTQINNRLKDLKGCALPLLVLVLLQRVICFNFHELWTDIFLKTMITLSMTFLLLIYGKNCLKCLSSLR